MTHDQLFEYIAVACGLLNIYFIVRQSNWNFLFGFINAACFFFLFHNKKIYADMGLHVIYMLFQIYGFYQWRVGGKNHRGVQTHYASGSAFAIACGCMVVIALTMAYVLSHYTDSTRIPLDASSTAICLVAQWMMSKKWIQNWWLWIIADVIAITMYLYKGLYPTAGLYSIYIIMCVIGLWQWHRSFQKAKGLSALKR